MTRAILVAVLVLACASPALALGALLPNGSFENTGGAVNWTSSVIDWTATPGASASAERLGLFYVFDGFSATDGHVYAGISNNGGGDQSLTSSTFTILRKTLRFDYVYATETPGDTANKDPFTVTLLTTGGSTITVADSMDPGLVHGDLGPSPFDGAPTYDTGWRTFTIDTTTLVGQTATLMFTLADSGTGGGVSGVFLDDVTQIPEPGTFALFGAGILGLALFGRRRLRRSRS